MRAEQELAADGLWPRDPADAQRPGEGRASSLYWGAAGVGWALDELAAESYIARGIVDRGLLEVLAARPVDDPDDPDFGDEGLWFGVTGVLAVAERRPPGPARRQPPAPLGG